MTPDIDLSFIHLIANASLVVKLVLLLLLVVSVLSWALIFSKWRVLRKADAEVRAFESRFWSGGDLSHLYRELSSRSGERSGMENIFVAGFKEFVRLRQQPGSDPMAVLEGVQRAMRVAMRRKPCGPWYMA